MPDLRATMKADKSVASVAVRVIADRLGRRIGRALLLAAALALGPAGSAWLQARPPAAAQRERGPVAPAAIDVFEKSIAELQTLMQQRKATSRQLVEAYRARIEAYDKQGPKLNAFILLNPHAVEDADVLDRERRANKVRGPLHGIPVVVKDNYATRDMPTTAGSSALAGFQTQRDAFLVRRLRDAGAVIVGKTNLHELAYGITTISSSGGQTLNPYALSRTPGGSSGGTGAAVAASFGAAGLGTDTCGSIRIPSAHNNLFGLRGTIGLSSRSGIVPLSHTQDIGGPLARTVSDLAIMLDATVGVDPDDPVTDAARGHVPATYQKALDRRGLKGARIGVLKALFGDAPEDLEVTTVSGRALAALRAAGAETPDIVVPGFADLLTDTSVINAEFKFDLQDFFVKWPGAPVKTLADILSSGKYHPAVEGVLKRAEETPARTSEAYQKALARRGQVRQAILDTMTREKLDALAYPTLRRKAATIGEPQAGSNCQLSASTGLPVLTIPAGFTDDGVPVGMDLLGTAFSEPALVKLAYAYEQSARPRRPPASTPSLR